MVFQFLSRVISITFRSIPIAVKSFKQAYDTAADSEFTFPLTFPQDAPPIPPEMLKWGFGSKNQFRNPVRTDEALKILDLDINSDKDQIEERCEILLKSTEDSFYLQSKVFRAKEKLLKDLEKFRKSQMKKEENESEVNSEDKNDFKEEEDDFFDEQEEDDFDDD